MSSSTDQPVVALDRGPFGDLPATLEWHGGADGFLRLLDQTVLPTEVTFRECRTVEDVWQAIRVLCVRGAPAIGVAAAYGLYLGARPHADAPADEFRSRLDEVTDYLCDARPTAVNLAWAVKRVREVGDQTLPDGVATALGAMLNEAHAMAGEDIDACRRIGEYGADLVPEGGGVITHCNAGALATVAYGTALSVLYVAHQRGRHFRVFADETRPLLQGARLTSFELSAAGLDVTVLCDNAAATLLSSGRVQMAVVGADRIAANGDTANKIGTYGLAILAKHHGLPFYVAAPRSTFDLDLPDGSAIPIEQRAAEEVGAGFGKQTVPDGVPCYNPAFDVTPAELVTGIITDAGVVQPVTATNIRTLFAQ